MLVKKIHRIESEALVGAPEILIARQCKIVLMCEQAENKCSVTPQA